MAVWRTADWSAIGAASVTEIAELAAIAATKNIERKSRISDLLQRRKLALRQDRNNARRHERALGFARHQNEMT
jgi:hypothetical protein